MNQEQRKLKKRKAKEAAKYKGLLKDRARRVTERQIEKEDFTTQKNHKKLMRKFQIVEEAYEGIKNDLTPEQRLNIEKNIEVLKSLESEFDLEAQQREELNKSLEEKGAITLKEKLDLINEIVKEENEKTEP